MSMPSNQKVLIQETGRLLSEMLPRNWKEVKVRLVCAKEALPCIASSSLTTFETEPIEQFDYPLTPKLQSQFQELAKHLSKPLCPIDFTFKSNGKYEIHVDISSLDINRLGVQRIKESIAKLKEVDLKTASIDELKKTLGQMQIGLQRNSPILPSNCILYRGISYPEKPRCISQLSYSPVNITKTFQRANRPGQPLFYCSESYSSPFFELRLSAGDKVIVGKWKTLSNMTVNNIGYVGDAFGIPESKRYCHYWNKTKFHDERTSLIEQFFTEEFTKTVLPGTEYKYKISIALAESLISQDMFDGLLYPSIGLIGTVDNLAIKPRFVDANMTLESVTYMRVDTPFNGHEYSITTLDWANSFTKDGQIEWKGRLPIWNLGKGIYRAVVENHQWVIRNERGDIIQPD